MKNRRWILCLWLSLAAMGLTAAGCESLSQRLGSDITSQRQQRQATVKSSVGLKRDAAEFQVAEDAWEHRQLAACETTLDAILERNPRHLESLILKTELCLAQEKLAAAEETLQQAVAIDATDRSVRGVRRAVADARGRTLPSDGVAQNLNAYDPAEGIEEDPLPESAGLTFLTDEIVADSH